MSKGTLSVQITDTAGNAIGTSVDIDLNPVQGPLGVGGDQMTASVAMGSSTDLDIAEISCLDGPGTTYRVLAQTDHYRPYGFFQLIREGDNTAADDVEFWVKPGDVKDIRAPIFNDLSSPLQAMLNGAQMVKQKPSDADLVGLSGAGLYAKLGPLRKAGLLNIATKAASTSADQCFRAFGSILISRQDRIFVVINDKDLPDKLQASPRFQSADSSLHSPLPGCALTGQSFKSRDAHANLQVTFQRRTADSMLIGDVDIDESMGIEHGFEVIRNAIFQSLTNPYLIHEFLLMSDPIEHTLDPGYSFVF
jgi:hypothetical protein